MKTCSIRENVTTIVQRYGLLLRGKDSLAFFRISEETPCVSIPVNKDQIRSHFKSLLTGDLTVLQKLESLMCHEARRRIGEVR